MRKTNKRQREFINWKKAFLKTDFGKSAQDIIDEISTKESKDKKTWLEREVLWIAFNAQNYDEKLDKYQPGPKNEKAGRKQLTPAINAVERLLDFNRNFETQASITSHFLIESLYKKVSLSPKPPLKKYPIRDLFNDVLEGYKRGLEFCKENGTPTKDSGWFIAGIQYPKIKPDGKLFNPSKDIKDPLKSSLFLHLVKVFRHYTAGQLDLGWAGEPMPSFGTPCNESVAGLSNAILSNPENKITENDVSKTVTRLIKANARPHSWKIPS